MLRTWKNKNSNATYATLLEACVESSNKDAAEKIVELLKGILAYNAVFKAEKVIELLRYYDRYLQRLKK